MKIKTIPMSFEKIIDYATRQKELVDLKMRVEGFSRGNGYKHTKICTNCCDISPTEIYQFLDKSKKLTSKGEIKAFRKLLREFVFGGLMCIHCYMPSQSGNGEGIIVSQEYGLNMQLEGSPHPEYPKVFLGLAEYHGYGNLEGRKEEVFNKFCRNKLGIEKDTPIKSIKPPIE
jgi:hypothetical protein